MLKHKKSTSGDIIRGRQGLTSKNLDLIARFLYGGRTGLQFLKSSGAL
jgi:hypothetical protein